MPNPYDKHLRNEAFLKGKTTYRPTTECRNGHKAERYTSTNACVECQYESKKRYNEAHKEEIAAYQKAYHAQYRLEKPEMCEAIRKKHEAKKKKQRAKQRELVKYLEEAINEQEESFEGSEDS